MKIHILVLAGLASFSFADETTVVTEINRSDEFETTVTAKKPVTAASETSIRERDLKLRPISRPADVLAVTPGLYVVQHAGGGKANQYFLRGFDADHGTDVAISVDGIPVNLVSHGHGQGYSDLNWLIAETVSKVEVSKGPYYGFLGDFGTAGGLNLVTFDSLKENRASIAGGMFNTLRATSLASADIDGWKPLIAVEGYYTDGPFEKPERTRRINYFLKTTKEFAQSKLTLGTSGYSGEWNASGQIPSRAVDVAITRFGNIDPNEGGDSRRYSVFGNYAYRPTADSEWKTLAYFAHSELSLFSDFTFFLNNPTDGDMINQTDNRNLYGVQSQYSFTNKFGEVSSETTVGLQTRRDDINNSLRNAPARVYQSSVAESFIHETSVATFVTNDTQWVTWLRTIASLRGDYYWFQLRDKLTDTDLGTRAVGQVSPKLSAVFSVAPQTDLFANYGIGFHSNDTRGIFSPSSSATPLSRAQGYELGARTKALNNRLDLASSLFLLDLESELVFVGDDGTTEAKGRSRRLGVEFEARYQFLSWLYADLDFVFSRGRFRDLAAGQDAIPNAPTRIVSGGVSVVHPDGYFGRLGFFHIADRAAKEDSSLTSEGFLRFDLSGGYRWKQFEVGLTVQNLLNTKWREAQFATETKLQSETASVEEIHFTPGAPINVKGNFTYYF